MDVVPLAAQTGKSMAEFDHGIKMIAAARRSDGAAGNLWRLGFSPARHCRADWEGEHEGIEVFARRAARSAARSAARTTTDRFAEGGPQPLRGAGQRQRGRRSSIAR